METYSFIGSNFKKKCQAELNNNIIQSVNLLLAENVHKKNGQFPINHDHT